MNSIIPVLIVNKINPMKFAGVSIREFMVVEKADREDDGVSLLLIHLLKDRQRVLVKAL
jgi:hypothetical protein